MDPQNPFVKNPNYFAPVVSTVYTQTALYYFHTASSLLATSLGAFLVCLLLYLIKFKTPQQFKPYAKIPLLCVMTDAFILTCNFFFQVRGKILNGTILVNISGILSNLDFSTQRKIICLQNITSMIGSAILPVNFFYSRRAPDILQTATYFCCSMIFCVVYGIIGYFAYNTRIEEMPDIDYGRLWYEELPIPKLIVGSVENRGMQFQISYGWIVPASCYIIAGVIAWRTVKEISMRSAELTERTKSVQRQFGRMLIAQSLTPLITSIVPSMSVTVAALVNLPTQYTGEFVVWGMTWYPVFSILFNICFIAPYRRYCIQKLCGCRKTYTINVISAEDSTRNKNLSTTPSNNQTNVPISVS